MMPSVKNWLKMQAARFDVLSLQKRISFFVLAVSCCFLAFQFLGLVPAQTAYQAAALLVDKQETELQKARAKLKAINFSGDASNLVRAELTALQTSTKAAKQLVQKYSSASAATTPLAETLVYLLRRHDRLKLLHMSTLTEASQTRREIASVLPAGILLQGLELTVSGAYPELTRYVATLENELKGIRWGTMKLKSEKLPPELTLQMFLMVIEP